MAVTHAPVLVVEDDPDVPEVICWLLEDEAISVDAAGNGREALERAAAYRPSLILLDLGLPHVDGFGVAAALRAAYGERAAPILTIMADGFAADKARRVGAIGFLRKPFDIDDLVAAVRRALEDVGGGT